MHSAPVFEAAVADLQELGQVIGANPTPILEQGVPRNQINGVGNIKSYTLEAPVGVIPQLPQLLGQTDKWRPEGDCSEDCRGAVDDGEFVVTGGQASPLLDNVKAALDDVAALVILRRRRPGGRPPREPRRLRCAIWSDGWGITAVIPRRRNSRRMARLEYALSARTRWGRVRGLPPPHGPPEGGPADVRYRGVVGLPR